MININCLICKKNETEIFKPLKISFNNYTLVNCKSCSFVYLNPRLSELEIKKYYNQNYMPFLKKKSIFNIVYKIFRKMNFIYKFFIITKYIPRKSKNLDIGSGDNFFSNSLLKKGWKSYAYDKYNYDKDNVRKLSILKRNSFDSITLWHSIEHMYDIEQTFTSINKILSSNGFLFIACPNIDAKEIDYVGKNWPAFDLPRHIYHFNYNSMKKFLGNYNLKIINIHNLKIDTFFNILMVKNLNFFQKTKYINKNLFYQFSNIKKSSTLVYVCQKY